MMTTFDYILIAVLATLALNYLLAHWLIWARQVRGAKQQTAAAPAAAAPDPIVSGSEPVAAPAAPMTAPRPRDTRQGGILFEFTGQPAQPVRVVLLQVQLPDGQTHDIATSLTESQLLEMSLAAQRVAMIIGRGDEVTRRYLQTSFNLTPAIADVVLRDIADKLRLLAIAPHGTAL